MELEAKYIIRFGEEDGYKSYYLDGKFNDGDYYIDGAWISDREKAKTFNSIEEAQQVINESNTIIPERWIIELL